jgi:hypothetical protein
MAGNYRSLTDARRRCIHFLMISSRFVVKIFSRYTLGDCNLRTTYRQAICICHATDESPQAREVVDHDLILMRQNDFVAVFGNMS